MFGISANITAFLCGILLTSVRIQNHGEICLPVRLKCNPFNFADHA